MYYVTKYRFTTKKSWFVIKNHHRSLSKSEIYEKLPSMVLKAPTKVKCSHHIGEGSSVKGVDEGAGVMGNDGALWRQLYSLTLSVESHGQQQIMGTRHLNPCHPATCGCLVLFLRSLTWLLALLPAVVCKH